MNIYKTVFDTEQQGKDVLIQKDVWEEVTEKGVTSMPVSYTHLTLPTKA